MKASDISFKTYNYSTNYSRYHVTVITNNSNSACKLTLETTFLDAEGKPVDLSSSSISALAPHTSVAVYDMPDYAYEKVTNKYTLEEFRYYTATTQNLSVSHNIMESNVIGTVTNNGTLAAEFTEVTALFFKDGQLVNIDRTYAVDSDYHIAPGMSESFKCSSYNEFDTVEFYLDSRGSRS